MTSDPTLHFEGIDELGPVVDFRCIDPYGWDWEEEQHFLTVSEFAVHFERGSISITADPDDDSVRVEGKAIRDLEPMQSLQSRYPWSSLSGSEVIWFWRLVNNLDYIDAVQVEFRRGLMFVTVQALAIAGDIRISWLVRESPA